MSSPIQVLLPQQILDIDAAQDSGEHRDVVIQSRAVLKRNFPHFAFPWKASVSELAQILEQAESVLSMTLKDARLIPAETASAAFREFAHERSLLASRASHAGQALLVDTQLHCVCSVNDGDHLRLQIREPGFAFSQALRQLQDWNGKIEAGTSWAAMPNYGYLTARVGECGSGLELEALVCLSGIMASDVAEQVLRDLVAQGIEPRFREFDDGASGAQNPFCGSLSPYLELIFRSPRSMTEEEALAHVERTLKELVQAERRIRARIAESRPLELEDAAWRSWAVLRHARLLEEDEARRLLSIVRFAAVHSRGPLVDGRGLPLAVLDSLYLGCSNARMALASEHEARGTKNPDEARAELVRSALARYSIR